MAAAKVRAAPHYLYKCTNIRQAACYSVLWPAERDSLGIVVGPTETEVSQECRQALENREVSEQSFPKANRRNLRGLNAATRWEQLVP